MIEHHCFVHCCEHLDIAEAALDQDISRFSLVLEGRILSNHGKCLHIYSYTAEVKIDSLTFRDQRGLCKNQNMFRAIFIVSFLDGVVMKQDLYGTTACHINVLKHCFSSLLVNEFVQRIVFQNDSVYIIYTHTYTYFEIISKHELL